MKADDLRLVVDPQRWPLAWCLCLAHRREIEHGLPALAFLLRDDVASGCAPMVYLGEVEETSKHLRAGRAVRTRSYETWDALLDDWRVD